MRGKTPWTWACCCGLWRAAEQNKQTRAGRARETGLRGEYLGTHATSCARLYLGRRHIGAGRSQLAASLDLADRTWELINYVHALRTPQIQPIPLPPLFHVPRRGFCSSERTNTPMSLFPCYEIKPSVTLIYLQQYVSRTLYPTEDHAIDPLSP